MEADWASGGKETISISSISYPLPPISYTGDNPSKRACSRLSDNQDWPEGVSLATSFVYQIIAGWADRGG